MILAHSSVSQMPSAQVMSTGLTITIQAAISQDYIGGLSLSSEEHNVLVAAADGTASLLDMRKSGARVSHVACGAPLHCAISDGCMALLGKENGEVGLHHSACLAAL